MDKDTFTELVQALQRPMYRIAVGYLASSADAEDAMQEALLRAWHRRHTLREPAYFNTWLIRILINECKTLLRKRRRQLPPPGASALSTAPEAAEAIDLRNALFSLPGKYRIPLILNALEGYTLQQIASLLSIPVGTVKSRVSRAKKKLKEEVSARGLE